MSASTELKATNWLAIALSIILLVPALLLGIAALGIPGATDSELTFHQVLFVGGWAITGLTVSAALFLAGISRRWEWLTLGLIVCAILGIIVAGYGMVNLTAR